MPFQGLLICIFTGSNLGYCQQETRQAVWMQARCKHINLIIFWIGRRPTLRGYPSIFQPFPNLR